MPDDRGAEAYLPGEKGGSPITMCHLRISICTTLFPPKISSKKVAHAGKPLYKVSLQGIGHSQLSCLASCQSEFFFQPLQWLGCWFTVGMIIRISPWTCVWNTFPVNDSLSKGHRPWVTPTEATESWLSQTLILKQRCLPAPTESTTWHSYRWRLACLVCYMRNTLLTKLLYHLC